MLMYWLVVYLPLWKIWKSVGIIIPNIWKVVKFMFQSPPTSTDNQCYSMTGWWFQPLWKIWKSVGIIFPHSHKHHVPNHQPDEMMNPAIACSIAWLAGSRFSWQTKPWRIVTIWLAHLPSGDLLHSELEAMTQLDDFPRNLHLLMDFHSYVNI